VAELAELEPVVHMMEVMAVAVAEPLVDHVLADLQQETACRLAAAMLVVMEMEQL
jgi:hypothetical protein